MISGDDDNETPSSWLVLPDVSARIPSFSPGGEPSCQDGIEGGPVTIAGGAGNCRLVQTKYHTKLLAYLANGNISIR